MDEPEAVLETLVKIKRLGIRVCLDDFGTGTSSLAVLQRLPFDRIKIDRGFVSHLGAGDGTDELVEGILALCRGLGLDIVAEGVETGEQRRRVAELGCTYAQGFLFSEAVAPERAGELLAAAPLDFESA